MMTPPESTSAETFDQQVSRKLFARRSQRCDTSLRLGALGLLHFRTCKSPQICRIHVRDSPEFESIMLPMQDVIAIFDKTLSGCTAARFRRPNEQVDNMFITLVDERSYFPTI